MDSYLAILTSPDASREAKCLALLTLLHYERVTWARAMRYIDELGLYGDEPQPMEPVQLRNPRTGGYTLIDREAGRIVGTSDKPFDGVPIANKTKTEVAK
jgi:hypothetical protein